MNKENYYNATSPSNSNYKSMELSVQENKILILDSERKMEVSMSEEKYEILYSNFCNDWGSRNDELRGLSMGAICSLNIPSSDNSALFMMASPSGLVDALKILEAWGFQYKTNLIIPSIYEHNDLYVHRRHEMILVGIKGKFKPPETESVFSDYYYLDEEENRKEIYNIIKEMYPNHRCAELFGIKVRENWDNLNLKIGVEISQKDLDSSFFQINI